MSFLLFNNLLLYIIKAIKMAILKNIKMLVWAASSLKICVKGNKKKKSENLLTQLVALII